MTDTPIQSLPAGEGQSAFDDEAALEAEAKQQVWQDWQHFITEGFRKSHFTESLYRFLSSSCGFIAHRNRPTFWAYYFDAEAIRLRLFLNQFGGNGCSVEFKTHAWLDGPATDLKQVMCQEMAPLYPPLLHVLETLEQKHAELGRAWREFALHHSPLWGSQDTPPAGGAPDPGYPPYYLMSENTRHILAYVARTALDHPSTPTPLIKSIQEKNQCPT